MKQFESFPINIIENSAKPKVVINASNDHSLFFKAYNDYSDLDGDGELDRTYKHSFDYYGYFDSNKCYVYQNDRFEPKQISKNNEKYCNVDGASGQWSGNFLNWASMSRIDAVRKVLFGGHRRVDGSPLNGGSPITVLERAYLPHDAHSWAKYYDGEDIPKLTPFSTDAADAAYKYNCDQKNMKTSTACQTDGVLDLKKVGITLGNTTDIKKSLYSSNDSSEDYITDPPLIKVARGNYSLWASNERWQVLWKVESVTGGDTHTEDGGKGTNGNNPADSGIYAYSGNPRYDTDGLGKKDYIARVVACYTNGADTSLIGDEKCKKYPSGNYKPIGLLQSYGDTNKMEFAMVAGSYDNHASGGAVVRTMGDFSEEVNVSTDGTFPFVHENAGGPITNDTKSKGLINAWSLFRIVGYNAYGNDDGKYNDSDSCPWALSAYDKVTNANVCRNWGNPFSEIYYQAIHYLAGMKVIGAFQDNMSDDIEGLVVPQELNEDPISEDDSCSQLSVINLNSSPFSYDADEIDSASEGPHKLWNISGLGVASMTDEVGTGQLINGKSFFIGETDVLEGITGTESDNQLCTPKTINNFGKAGGMCPEAPRTKGSFSVAGLAYYAHTKDIRPDGLGGGRGRDGLQIVDTYSVAMATSVPLLEVPDPSNKKQTIATIVPACRNTSLNPKGNCAIVDFKIIKQDIDNGTGEVFIVWEDSEQGGDYDQDMWGTLKYSINKAANTIAITTDVIAESTGDKMGFGYVIGGTLLGDGFHAHSGIEGYTSTSDTDATANCSSGCYPANPASTKTYTLGSSTTQLLKDPLWYAAKWGGFTEKNGIPGPDQVEEWDSKINETWKSGQDGIPDNYFYASNPKKLEEAIDRVLSAILERTSSGTAAAVVSSNVRGEGALFQAYYEPLKKDGDVEARWIGTLQALWLDSFGLTRQDCSLIDAEKSIYDPENATSCPAKPLTCGEPNGHLDDYCIDNVVETFYDEGENKTRVKVFNSNAPDQFSAYSMQGVVKTYATGAGTGVTTLVPNYMEGNYNATSGSFSPYELKGKITAYNITKGEATISVDSWVGKNNTEYSSWSVSISSSDNSIYASSDDAFYSDTAIALATNTSKIVKLSPLDPSIATALTSTPAVELSLTFHSKNIVGKQGDAFDDWDVKCLEGATATGKINSSKLVISNSATSTIAVDGDTAADVFTDCVRVSVSTYDTKGASGVEYKGWEVANLDTILGKGTSNSTLELANSGPLSLVVDPTLDWLKSGERVLLSNYNYSIVELYQINYLWNGREQLTALNSTLLETNRDYSEKAQNWGRYIKTWIDKDLDGVVDRDLVSETNDEFKKFETGVLDSVNYNFFDVDTKPEAEDVINYIRGIEVANTRSRTIKYFPDDTTEGVMRLGDIINSTPTVVGSPQEAFDLLYFDSSYSGFRTKYQNRRVVVYVGGNDGLLHAFNGGFYNVDTSTSPKTVEYSVSGKKSDGTDATEHALGSEIWAYAPKNLLPHLRWLKDGSGYPESHVYYVDGKPRVFDANIFPSNSTHPNGWGTVLVVGMNLGGGQIKVDADTTPTNGTNAVDGLATMKSAYMIFDITDPEVEPVLLGEIPLPDSDLAVGKNSFTTVYPAVAAFRDPKTAVTNKWYLVFGNGPDNIKDYDSSQNAEIYMFDLSQLISGVVTSPTLTGAVTGTCSTQVLTPSPYKVVKCDSGLSESFVGTPMVVDWELDFYSNASYFGLVGDDSATKGKVMRLDFNNVLNTSMWDPLETVFDAERPIMAQPVPAIDNKNKRWLYFGTGRYFTGADKNSTPLHTLYGIREDGGTVTSSQLINASNVEVYSDGNLVTPLTGAPVSGTVTTFKQLETQVDTNVNVKGWKLNLPQIVGIAGTDPSTRNTTRSTLLGGVLFSSVFQPSIDQCKGEGLSRLYGLYYKTGTAYPDPSVLGSRTVNVTGEGIKYISKKFLELGRGVATAPAIHSGTGSGSDTVRVFTQLSTGDIIEATADTITPVRTGKTSWSDREN